MNKALLLAVGLGLAACAPIQTRGELSSDAPFIPTGQELTNICANQPQVAEGGALIWNTGPIQDSRQAPYLLSCPEFTLKNDGATLTVQDITLQKALAHFDPNAYFLTYYADLLLRFPEDGLASADSTESVPEKLIDDVRKITVTASQEGKPELTLLKDMKVTPVRYDPGLPLKLVLRGNQAITWPELTVEANKGLITAPVFR